jgi:hypothetical protein
MSRTTPEQACDALYTAVVRLHDMLSELYDEKQVVYIPRETFDSISNAMDYQHIQAKQMLNNLKSSNKLDGKEANIIRRIFALEDMIRTLLNAIVPVENTQ